MRDKLRQVDFIVAPRTKNPHKDYERIASRLAITYNHLMHIMQFEGEPITVVQPEWLEICTRKHEIVDHKAHMIELPIKQNEEYDPYCDDLP